MKPLTDADTENLVDFIEIIEARDEDDSDVLHELGRLKRRLENGETPLASEADTLRALAREFVHAWEEEPGAKEDPNRADFTGLMDRLNAIAGGAR